MPAHAETDFQPILEQELSNDDDFYLPELRYSRTPIKSLLSILCQWGWQISTTILLFVSFGLLLRLHRVTTNTYENGFKTDLQAITKHIKLEEVVFENEIVLSDKGKLVRVPGNGPQYVGEPSVAIDDAWEDLLIGLNVDLKGAEADDVRDKTYKWPESDVFYSGVHMFHSLHCLNELRKALYPDYYAEENMSDAAERVQKVHQEHCLDYIRQSLQCSGDLTPMNWAWIERTKKIMFKPSTPHTCRKFDGVWDWVAERKVDWDTEEKHGYNRGHTSKHTPHQNTPFLQNITKN